MAIKHKKSFLTGYLTGQAIKRGFNSTLDTHRPDGSGTLRGYDAASFKAGLAAGLCGDGYLLPYTPPEKKPGIFDVEVNCDEVIIDLYLRNARGEATAPSIYGLQDMGRWLRDNNVKTISDFYAFCESAAPHFGGVFSKKNAARVTALFYNRSYLHEICAKKALPFSYLIRDAYMAGKMTWEQFTDNKLSVDSRLDNWTFTLTQQVKADCGASGTANLLPVYVIKTYVLCPGRYRFSFAETVSPPFDDDGTSKAWVAVAVPGVFGNTSNLKTKHSQGDLYYLASGESLEFEVPVGSLEHSHLFINLWPWPPFKVDGYNAMTDQAHRSYHAGMTHVQTLAMDLQLVEIYPMRTPNKNANLTSLLRAVDALDDYKIKNEELDRLEDLTLVDEYRLMVSGSPHDPKAYRATAAKTKHSVGEDDLPKAQITALATVESGMNEVNANGVETPVDAVSLSLVLGEAAPGLSYQKHQIAGEKLNLINSWTAPIVRRRDEEK